MEQETKLKKKQKLEKEEKLDGYNGILQDIKSILEKAKYRAYKAVDNLRVQTYWQVGERIVREELQHKERADYGESVIKHLARDLGISERNLHNSVKFYKAYPILQTVSAQLSWSHYVELIYLGNKEERQFYEQQIIQNALSIRELREQIKNKLYAETKSRGKVVIAQPLVKAKEPEQIFKDTYNFKFLELEKGYGEEDLENSLIRNMERLLLELGYDFSLSGRQRKIIIDGQIHQVDLEFYHRGIPCIILVELKVGKFRSEYIGQMNKYLNYYKEHKKYPWEKDPIGLIICEHKGEEEVYYALGGITNKIFVAKYKTKLPSEDDIKDGLKRHSGDKG